MKSAIVTGAGAGIGEAISKKLSDNNYRVGMLDLNQDNVIEASKKIDNTTPLCGDVTQEESIVEAFKEFGETPDLLVNNVGIVLFGPLEEHSINDYSKSLNINLLGSFITSRILITDMIKRGSGSIINMSSINGINPGIGIGAYPASKAGIISMTQQMAIEWGKFGIRSNTICPGLIKTKFSSALWNNDSVIKMVNSRLPLRRIGEPSEISGLALFLASDASSYCTGQSFTADGGHMII